MHEQKATAVWSDRDLLATQVAALLPQEVATQSLILVPSAPTAEVCEQLAARLRPEAGEKAVILVSSTEIQAPSWRCPGMGPEASLRALRRQGAGEPLARAWVDLEQVVVDWATKAGVISWTVLRCAPFPGRWGAFSPLGGRRALWGHDPLVQALSTEDLGRALRRVLERTAEWQELQEAQEAPLAVPSTPSAGPQPQVFHIVPADAARWSQLRRAARTARPRPPADRPSTFSTRAHRRYDWTVGGDLASRELGFQPQHPTLHAAGAAEAQDLDPYGRDDRFIERAGRWVLGPLAQRYFRLEISGLEHVPDDGPAILAGMHRGFMPLDAMVLLDQVRRSKGRVVRFLIHPALQRFPMLSPIFSRLGGLVANRRNAEWVLRRNQLLGLFPEGVQGAFSLYRDAYRIHRFARDEFVRMAIAHDAPIVPFVHAGPAEVFPMLAHVRWPAFEQFTGWPTFPITSTFPFLPPVPLPAKWHVHLLPPIRSTRTGPAAARDRDLVRELSARCREEMEAALAELLDRRPSRWWGSLRAARETST